MLLTLLCFVCTELFPFYIGILLTDTPVLGYLEWLYLTICLMSKNQLMKEMWLILVCLVWRCFSNTCPLSVQDRWFMAMSQVIGYIPMVYLAILTSTDAYISFVHLFPNSNSLCRTKIKCHILQIVDTTYTFNDHPSYCRFLLVRELRIQLRTDTIIYLICSENSFDKANSLSWGGQKTPTKTKALYLV